MPTERAAAASSVVASIVKNKLSLPDTPDSLLAGLSISVEPDTNFLDFSYSDPSPRRAQLLANAFSAAYLANRNEINQKQTDATKAELNSELQQTASDLRQTNAALKKRGDPTGTLSNRQAFDYLTISNLNAQIRNLTALPGAGGIIFQPATLPTSTSSPSYPQNLVLALVIGLALGAGIAFLRERLNEGLRGSGDLEEQIQAPILAAIPHLNSWKRRDNTQLIVLEAPHGPVTEAYRTLRTNLDFVARDGAFKILMVTSPTLGEGKTTTVANLAAILAQSGKRVIAVSCDLRKPRLHRFFGLTNDIGVTSILTGKATLAQAAQRPEGLDSLRVLASGPVPPNPAELLGSEDMQSLLDELRMFADFVVLDTPPILAVADALVLGPKSDGVLIVADAHKTTRQSAAHTREQLRQIDSNIVGCIFNNFDPSQAKYYPYDSRYYYSSYAYQDPETKQYIDAPSNGKGDNGHKEPASVEDLWRSS
jgi:capsular exopolysaccharide synthesis family protein